jgi:Tol biopolymer transport system component
MIRKTLIGMIGLVVVITLSGCGAAQQVTQTFSVPCRPSVFRQVLWSPDGELIAFQGGYYANYPRLYVISPLGANVREIAIRPTTLLDLQWLPDGKTLAYTEQNAVVSIGLDGSASADELWYTANSGVRFSPDGRWIAYSRLSRGGAVAGIDRTNHDGSNDVRLTAGPDVFYEWSPDSQRIAYTHRDGLKVTISTIRVDGGGKRHLTEGAGNVRWSYDGAWLAFNPANPRYAVWIVRADGGDEKLVTTDADHGEYQWVTGGHAIAYVSVTDQLLKVIDVATLAVETLSTIPVEGGIPPAWSPDGGQVAFVGIDGGGAPNAVEELYVVNRDGSGLRPITDNPGKYNCFRWPF